MSMYQLFETDPTLEVKGVIVDYGDFRVTLARAGGANKKFQKQLEIRTKPYRRAMETGTMDNDKAQELLYEVFADTIILNWEVKDEEGKWKPGIESSDGKVIPFNRANVIATFKKLHDLFLEMQDQSNKVALFRDEELKDDAGN